MRVAALHAARPDIAQHRCPIRRTRKLRRRADRGRAVAGCRADDTVYSAIRARRRARPGRSRAHPWTALTKGALRLDSRLYPSDSDNVSCLEPWLVRAAGNVCAVHEATPGLWRGAVGSAHGLDAAITLSLALFVGQRFVLLLSAIPRLRELPAQSTQAPVWPARRASPPSGRAFSQQPAEHLQSPRAALVRAPGWSMAFR